MIESINCSGTGTQAHVTADLDEAVDYFVRGVPVLIGMTSGNISPISFRWIALGALLRGALGQDSDLPTVVDET